MTDFIFLFCMYIHVSMLLFLMLWKWYVRVWLISLYMRGLDMYDLSRSSKPLSLSLESKRKVRVGEEVWEVQVLQRRDAVAFFFIIFIIHVMGMRCESHLCSSIPRRWSYLMLVLRIFLRWTFTCFKFMWDGNALIYGYANCIKNITSKERAS